MSKLEDTDNMPLSVHEAAVYLGVSMEALAQMRHKGNTPKYYQPTPRRTFYYKKDLDDWIRGQNENN